MDTFGGLISTPHSLFKLPFTTTCSPVVEHLSGMSEVLGLIPRKGAGRGMQHDDLFAWLNVKNIF